jgi:hypothetical protein
MCSPSPQSRRVQPSPIRMGRYVGGGAARPPTPLEARARAYPIAEGSPCARIPELPEVAVQSVGHAFPAGRARSVREWFLMRCRRRSGSRFSRSPGIGERFPS